MKAKDLKVLVNNLADDDDINLSDLIINSGVLRERISQESLINHGFKPHYNSCNHTEFRKGDIELTMWHCLPNPGSFELNQERIHYIDEI